MRRKSASTVARPPPEAFGVPWEERGIERLKATADHLNQVINRLALAS